MMRPEVRLGKVWEDLAKQTWEDRLGTKDLGRETWALGVGRDEKTWEMKESSL